MKKISVILPVYKKDNPLWLHKAIDSVLAQTYRSFHIYIGVDGPVEQNLETVLSSYENLDEVGIVRFRENRGLACVLNDLLEMSFSEGFEYIARMDADDICTADRFEKQIAFFELHPEVDVIGGAVLEIDENDNSRNKILVYPETHDECFRRFAKRNPLAHPAVMFKKSLFDKSGCLYRPEYRKNQDTLLWYDGLKGGAIMGNVQDVILNFRHTEEMIKSRRSGKDAAKKQLDARLMINKGLGYGWTSDVYAYAIYVMMVSPVFIRKMIYKFLN